MGKYENTGSFGELALMYNMPRAATIIATSEGSLWAMVGSGRARTELNFLLLCHLQLTVFLIK